MNLGCCRKQDGGVEDNAPLFPDFVAGLTRSFHGITTFRHHTILTIREMYAEYAYDFMKVNQSYFP